MNRQQRRQAERDATRGGKILELPTEGPPIEVGIRQLIECIETAERFRICPDGHVVMVMGDDPDDPQIGHLTDNAYPTMVARVQMLGRVAAMWLASQAEGDDVDVVAANGDAEVFRISNELPPE